MNRLLSWLIVLGLASGMSACDRHDGVPLPRTGAGEVKQQAKELVGAVENTAKEDKDQFVAAVQNDVQEIKAKIGDLKSRITKAAGKGKAAMEQQITALEEEAKVAEQKLTDLKSAAVEKWKGLQQDMSTALDHLRQSVQKVEKESA